MALFPSAASHNTGAFFPFFCGQKTESTRASAFGWLISSFRHNK
ncbi:MAG: hypothetical protein UW94_C0001G0097 [Parcubacteria group bacterium GW2011_GWA2_45_14]|nr:MAG: hypothetical protein UW94_C0001G0097 [Parcubacteria group bacterium GW2011_GWA2_45_14]